MWISIWGRKTMPNASFMFMYLLMHVTTDAASCWTLAAFILILQKSGPKIRMHIKHCWSSAKAIAILKYTKITLYWCSCFLRNWWLASNVDIVWKFLLQNLWNDSAKRLQYTTHVWFSHSTVEKEFLIHVIEICFKSGILIKGCRYWLLNWRP